MVLTAMVLIACDIEPMVRDGEQDRIEGSGELITEARPVTGFTEISFFTEGTITITQGDTETLAVETDDNLLDRVYMREELYHGPYVDEAADIIFLPKDMKNKALGTLDFTSNHFGFPVHGNTGDHRMEGIFVGIGEAFRQGGSPDQLSILDIAPTVLYLLGLPVPNEMDGKVASEILEDSYVARNPIEYADVELLGRARGSALGSEDSEDIKRRLEGIGYIG